MCPGEFSGLLACGFMLFAEAAMADLPHRLALAARVIRQLDAALLRILGHNLICLFGSEFLDRLFQRHSINLLERSFNLI